MNDDESAVDPEDIPDDAVILQAGEIVTNEGVIGHIERGESGVDDGN